MLLPLRPPWRTVQCQAGPAAAGELGARFVQIDVTSDEPVAAAAANAGQHEGSIDALISNAGVHGPHGDPGGLTGAGVLPRTIRREPGPV